MSMVECGRSAMMIKALEALIARLRQVEPCFLSEEVAVLLLILYSLQLSKRSNYLDYTIISFLIQ